MKKIMFLAPLFLLFACNNISFTNHKKQIAIQPLGDYDASLLDSLQTKIEKFYGIEAIVNKQIQIPKQFYTNIKSPRYRADSIIRFLKHIKPDSITYIIGFTNHDITITKKGKDGNTKKPVKRYTDWAIFGLGFRPGSSCVVSSRRLGRKKSLRIERAQKVALHELGHNMGLKHCPDKTCFMQDAAETIKTIDKVNFNLCEACKRNI